MTGAFKGAVLSFFSGQFYGQLARERRGVGLGLVFVLALALTVLFFLSFFAAGLYSQTKEALSQLPVLADKLPAITIKDGKLSIDKPSPYTLALGSDPDGVRIVIDTNYKLTDAATLEKYMQKNRIVWLFTADQFVSRDPDKNGAQQMQSGDTLHIASITDSQPFSITHNDWRSLGAAAGSWSMPALTAVSFMGMLLAMFVLNFFATLFSAVAIMVVDMLAQAEIEFSAAMRLAAAFRIPALLLSLFPVLIGMNPLMGISGWILWGLYLVFALWSVKLYGGKRV